MFSQLPHSYSGTQLAPILSYVTIKSQKAGALQGVSIQKYTGWAHTYQKADQNNTQRVGLYGSCYQKRPSCCWKKAWICNGKPHTTSSNTRRLLVDYTYNMIRRQLYVMVRATNRRGRNQTLFGFITPIPFWPLADMEAYDFQKSCSETG